MKSKIDEARGQALLELVRYTLDFHEWCEYPFEVDARCGQRHQIECTERDGGSGEECPGCTMKNQAEYVAKWKATY